MEEENHKEQLVNIMRKIKKLNIYLLEGINHSDFHMFKEINRIQSNVDVPQVNVSDLAEELKVSVPAVSKKLKSLEERGYIERIIDKNNRRNTFVILTKDGQEKFDKAEKVMDNYMNKVFIAMGKEETETLIRLSYKLYNIMENEVRNFAEDN
ncbi:MAG TPA: MarR family transcriptional regulator [Clostridiales bacterium]|nr:MarR family transcriptional regulator [Clostridiales bacterium]